MEYYIIMKETSITLWATGIIVGSIFIAAASASIHPPHEVIIETDETTENTGSIIMLCRDDFSENIPVREIKFFLNHSSVDVSLRERDDFNVVEVDRYRIKFNLTRSLEGNYTCGRRVNSTHVIESLPRTLVCKLV